MKSLLNIDEGDAKCGKGLSNYYFLRWIHNTDFSMGSAVKPKNPHMTENVMLEVSDEIAATLSMGGRLCDSYKRQKRRNGECSLDTDPGFEADVLRQPMTPDEYIEARETTFALYDALTQLPPTQARRVYQHYLLGMSKAEIAAAEGVGRSRICCSIERGLAAMKNILKKSL